MTAIELIYSLHVLQTFRKYQPLEVVFKNSHPGVYLTRYMTILGGPIGEVSASSAGNYVIPKTGCYLSWHLEQSFGRHFKSPHVSLLCTKHIKEQDGSIENE